MPNRQPSQDTASKPSCMLPTCSGRGWKLNCSSRAYSDSNSRFRATAPKVEPGRGYGADTSGSRRKCRSPHHTALRIEDRRGAAGEEAVEAEEVLATEDFHRGLLDQRSADRIRTAQGLVPDCARLQRDLLRTRDELRIAHTVNQHAAGVGEHHQAIRRPDLLVTCSMMPWACAIRRLFLSHASRNRRRYHAVVTRNRAIGQSATTTSLPRAQHRVLYQFIRAASTIEEQFPRFVQTSVNELPTAARVVSSRLLHETLIFVFLLFSKIPSAVSQSSTCSKLKQTISDQRQSETSKKQARTAFPASNCGHPGIAAMAERLARACI